MKPSLLQATLALAATSSHFLARAADASSSSSSSPSTTTLIDPANNSEGPIFTIQTKTDLSTTVSLPSEAPGISVSGVTTVPKPHIPTNTSVPASTASPTTATNSAATPEPTPSSIKAAGEQLAFDGSMMGMVVFCALGVMILG